MPNSGKISVKALSIISHGGCHVFLHRSSGGNVENIRYENSLYRSLIHYHTLLLPIHDFEKEENTSKQFEEKELLVQTY
jgi:hypothetical protein